MGSHFTDERAGALRRGEEALRPACSGSGSRACCWADNAPLPPTSIEGEYVPVEGDEVTYKMCPIPPKNQKFQAVEVVLTQLAPHTPHETWSGQVVGS